jgi:hypothetical protein
VASNNMERERWQRLEQVCQAALDRPRASGD